MEKYNNIQPDIQCEYTLHIHPVSPDTLHNVNMQHNKL